MRPSIRRPSPALIVACIALLVALGGTSFATVLNVPKNSVGAAQLKKNAVISSKVKNRSLLAVDFKTGQLPAGPIGPQGANGARGDKGEKGDKGDAGPPGLSDYEIVQATNQVTNANFNLVQINCPPGKKVLGGGILSSPLTAGGPYVTVSFPTGTSGWRAGTARVPASSWTVTGYAICAKVS